MIFIPPKDTEHCAMNFFDTETGENLGQVENIKEISMSHFSETEEEHNKHGDINWFKYKNEEYTMSVDFDKESRKGYLAEYNENKLGIYPTVEMAYEVYASEKEKSIRQLADEYKNIIPEKVYNALYAYRFDINNDKNYKKFA